MGYARLFRLFLYWCCLSCVGTLALLGQGWSADLSRDGVPSSAVWRYDTQDFLIQDGWLSLNAPRAKGAKLLVTSVHLPERMHWSGLIRFDHSTSVQNHAYVLLGCSEADKARGAYVYLALSIGGGARGSVALVRLSLHKPADGKPIQVLREEVLIDVGRMPSSLYSALGYDVWYDGAERLVLGLSAGEDGGEPLFRAEAEYDELRSGANGFGVLCYFSATRHRAMHFSRLCIDADDPNRSKPRDEPNEPKGEQQPLMLTEVMANPLANCPEYVEVYNPNESAVSFAGYHLAVGSNVDKMREVYLSDNEELDGKSYAVLCSSPQALYDTYPHCPQGAVRLCPLPRMANAGCTLILYKDAEEVDRVVYDPALLGRGVKTKRGVALERIALDRERAWQGASRSSGYASPGLANGRGGDSEDEGQGIGIKELLEMQRKETKCSLSICVYHLNGTQALHERGEAAQALMQRLASEGLGGLAGCGLRRGELYLLRAELLDEWGEPRERVTQALSLM